MPITQQRYQAITLADPEGRWELHEGRLREKPPMSITHNWSARRLGRQLMAQLDPDEFEVSVDMGRVRRLDETTSIPDVMVVPMASVRTLLLERPEVLETYDAPLPLVVEVWSPSTGDYDVDSKIPAYLKRGDAEVWRVHLFERTVTAWRRQPDGGYTETLFAGGRIRLWALPEVTIDLDALFNAR